MTTRVVDATAAAWLDHATAIVFEYMATTQGEVGLTVPRTVDELPPTLRDECRSLAVRYARPGALFLAVQANAAVGCVVVVPVPADDRVVEVKRLYVRAAHRGHGVATALMHAAHAHARTIGVTRVVLTVLPSRTGAVALYQRLGYVIDSAVVVGAHDMMGLSRSL